MVEVINERKKKNRNRNKNKGDVNKRCKQQAAEWTAFIQAECENDGCLERFLPCAEPLRTCNFTNYVDCVFIEREA
jgi:hypothetical protein